jgi:putative ABC transport system permease protein
MAQTMEALGRKYPDQEKDRAYRLVSLVDDLVGDLRAVLLIVFAATGLLLALAVANVTNLTLARGTGRAREIAIRAALGASRRQLMTLLISESLLTAICVGALGVTVAFMGTTLLLRAGAAHLPRLAAVSFDVRVLAFAIAATTFAGVLVGLAPALRMADTDVASLLNESGRSVRGSRKTRRLLGGFVIAEVAIAVALVAGAGRLIRSFDNLQRVDPGFDPRGVLAVDVLLPYNYNSIERVDGWWQQVDRRLRSLGATHVAAASALPLRHEADTSTFVDIPSQPAGLPEKRPNGRLRRITPGFFAVMGIRLHSGRSFSEADNAAAPPVVIVNQAFVRRFLGSADPLQERFKDFGFVMVDGKPQRRDATIVGVAGDVQYAGLAAVPEPTVYVPISQVAAGRLTVVLTTADARPERLVPQLRSAFKDIDPAVPTEFHPVSSFVSAALERQRIGMLLMTLFGVAALALSLIGVFGVISYVVAQRTGEMAVRQALGASRSHIFWLIGAHGGRLAVVGSVIGLALAWWMGRVVSAYVFHVNAADPFILAASAGLVTAAAACATLWPAWTAATRDPRMSLRDS